MVIPRSDAEFAADTLLEYVQHLMQPEGLSYIQSLVLRECWEGSTYQLIAQKTGYDDNYVRGIGAQLWRELSKLTGQKVTKHNFRLVLQLALADAQSQSQDSPLPTAAAGPRMANQANVLRSLCTHSEHAPKVRQESVRVETNFYIERPPIEANCYSSILQPGALIRIRAAKQMGKTSLMSKIMEKAWQANYKTVTLNLALANREILADVDRFLQWFCVMVGKGLGLPSQLDDYWVDICGSSYNCTEYFEDYLLENQQQPVVLALDNVDEVFNYPDLAKDFFGVLRAWYESARYHGPKSELWQRLRLIVVYSTEVYIPLNIHQSPFNVGLSVALPPFNQDQILTLIAQHSLSWTDKDVTQLMDWVGGNPYLVQLALQNGRQMTVQDILSQGISPQGIYASHLKERFWLLQTYPSLQVALVKVMKSADPVEMDLVTLLKLEGMGLIHIAEGRRATPACQLYREYFSRVSLPEEM